MRIFLETLVSRAGGELRSGTERIICHRGETLENRDPEMLRGTGGDGPAWTSVGPQEVFLCESVAPATGPSPVHSGIPGSEVIHGLCVSIAEDQCPTRHYQEDTLPAQL